MRNWFRNLHEAFHCPAPRRTPGPRLLVEGLEDRCVPAAVTSGYLQTNLVSDIPGLARTTDPNLVNPWGIASSSSSPFWISDNGTGVATLYNGEGQPFPAGAPLVVTIPPPAGSSATAAPTGDVFNTSSGFVVSAGGQAGAARFLFATEDGTIAGWNPTVNPTRAILA